MEKSPLIKKVLEGFSSEKTKDYTYLTIFFVVFSIFIIFAIRPSLVTAFSLRKEEDDLRRADQAYDRMIDSVVSNQTFLEQSRDKLPILSQALPELPNVNQVLNDIQRISSEKGVPLSDLSVQEVSLVNSQTKGKKTLTLQAQTEADFAKISEFIQSLQNQRRLKNIKMISIDTGENSESTQSATLKINIEIETFYL